MPLGLVITELDVGGAERALVALATGLDRARWHPRVYVLGPEAPLAAPLRAWGVRVTCLDVSARHPIRAVRRLGAMLRKDPPELVQSFLFHANVAARLAGPLAGRPWVVGGLRVAERQKRWHLAMERATSRLATGAVCVSEGVRRFSRDVAGWPNERLTVIPNGVDVARIDRAGPANRSALGVPEDAFLILFVGRLHVQKGLHTLLDAAERLSAGRPGLDWRLALAGEGPERAGLTEHIAARPALRGRVHLLGRRDDVPALLKASDLFVLPSLWEGMPNSLLEAMAARRAAIGTAVEGTEDLIVPGATGWLVPPADVDALAASLIDAASDPERLRRFGEAGRARVETEFTPGAVVRAYEHLWAGLLGYSLDEAPG